MLREHHIVADPAVFVSEFARNDFARIGWHDHCCAVALVHVFDRDKNLQLPGRIPPPIDMKFLKTIGC